MNDNGTEPTTTPAMTPGAVLLMACLADDVLFSSVSGAPYPTLHAVRFDVIGRPGRGRSICWS